MEVEQEEDDFIILKFKKNQEKMPRTSKRKAASIEEPAAVVEGKCMRKKLIIEEFEISTVENCN